MSEPIITKKDRKLKKDDQASSDWTSSDWDDSNDDEIIHDFPSMFIGLFKSVPWKLSSYLFILLIVLFSKQFIEYVLFPMGKDKLVDGDQTTNVGTIVLCLMASLGLIILHLVIKCDVL